MKRINAFLIVAGLLAGIIAAFVIRNWDPYRSIPMVTIERLNRYESDWYSQGISDYRIQVSAAFADERRLYDITVRAGRLAEAQSSTWNPDTGDWAAPNPVGDEDASFFTVAGIFSTVRSSLLNEDAQREYLRMELDAADAFPTRVLYGPLLDDGFVMDETELVIEVLSFEEIQ